MSGPGPEALLSFRLAGAVVALPLGVVREVMDRPRVVPVPECHAHVAGVTLAHGLAVPVYDLRRFGPLWTAPPPADGTAPASLIVCAWGEVLIGLLGREVDVIDRRTVRDIPGREAAQEGPEAPLHSGYARSIAHDGRGQVMVLDAARLFASLGVPDPRVREAGEEDGEENPAGR